MQFTNKKINGFSLIEVLVVITIFAVLGVLISRSILLTLGGGQKTETIVKVRENLNYAVGVIERQLRNANSIADCTNANPSVISYTDQNGEAASFSCVNVGPNTIGYVASGSAQLTNSTVDIVSCTFTCNQSTTGSPDSITINVSAQDASANGSANSIVTTSNQVFLRNY